MGDPVRQLGVAVEAGLAVARDEPARVRPPRWAACFSLLVGAPPLRTERICDQLLRQVLLPAVPTDLRVSCMCCRRAARRPRRSRAKATRTEKASTYRCRTQMHSRSCHAPSIERSQSRTFVLACSDLLLVALDLLVLVDERLQQVETPIFEQTTNLCTQSATLEPTKPRPRVRASSAVHVPWGALYNCCSAAQPSISDSEAQFENPPSSVHRRRRLRTPVSQRRRTRCCPLC